MNRCDWLSRPFFAPGRMIAHHPPETFELPSANGRNGANPAFRARWRRRRLGGDPVNVGTRHAWRLLGAQPWSEGSADRGIEAFDEAVASLSEYV
jgi:hypothetical protein